MDDYVPAALSLYLDIIVSCMFLLRRWSTAPKRGGGAAHALALSLSLSLSLTPILVFLPQQQQTKQQQQQQQNLFMAIMRIVGIAQRM